MEEFSRRRRWWGALELGVCAPFRCGFAPHSRESLILPLRGANFFAWERRRRRWGFAPHSRKSLIIPSRGANQLPGKGAGGCEGLRLTSGKALLFRRGAQSNCREEPPASVWVCASPPGKPYYSVEGRKPIARKSLRWRCGFAPHSRKSLILPLRGANRLPGKGAGGRVSLRLTLGKALFFR